MVMSVVMFLSPRQQLWITIGKNRLDFSKLTFAFQETQESEKIIYRGDMFVNNLMNH